MTRYRPGAMLAEIGVIAALYAALTLALPGISYGQFQFRVSEILKSLVIWEPHLIPAFVVGNFLSNLGSPFGVWDIVFMPFVNLIGASLCHLVGRWQPPAGAALYALIVAAAVSSMLSILLGKAFVVLFPALLASEAILIVGGVPVMRAVLRAAEPTRRRWRAAEP